MLDGMIVRRAVLGQLVRATIISATKFLKYATMHTASPYAARRQRIAQVANEQKVQVTSGVVLSELLLQEC